MWGYRWRWLFKASEQYDMFQEIDLFTLKEHAINICICGDCRKKVGFVVSVKAKQLILPKQLCNTIFAQKYKIIFYI